MPLEIGSRVGSYEITSRLGAGGMGVVFRARDTKLGRDVAIKVLPDAMGADQERLQRFRREAHVLAALNHSNIAQIYGLEDSSESPCIVMEFVHGETLADRLQRGPIPVHEALEMAMQIVMALEAAHEKGIVHRDLKPGNVMVLADGNIKVLDFGLAKVHDGTAASSGLSNSPTMISASLPGSILGTAAYMAPEQAKGLNADARSDLFSFGCMLSEMLGGRPAFDGDTVAEVLASVLKTEPDLSRLPADVSGEVRKLLHRCLQKNPKNRWHSTADVRLELQSILDGGSSTDEPRSAPAGPQWKRRGFVALATFLGMALGAIAVWTLTSGSPELPVVRLSMILPENQLLNLVNRPLAISPDGTQIAYFAKGQMYLRSISELEGKPIAGTEDAIGATSPVFSPDGGSLAYLALSSRSLKRISTTGGAAVTLASIDRLGLGGLEWTDSGILFSQGYREIMQISENGGQPQSLIKAQGSERIGMPHMLPDGKTVLFSTFDTSRNQKQIAVQRLDWSNRKILMELEVTVGALADARYLSTGHIIYVQAGTLFAVSFDLDRLEIGSNPLPVIPGVRVSSSLEPLLSVSHTGSLLYIPGPVSDSVDRFTLAMADREGSVEGVKLPAGPYQTPRVSPDGKRLAFGIDDGTEANIWLYDLSRGGSPSRLTFGGKNRFPVWSPKGDRIAFQSDREDSLAIFSQRVDGDGQAERLTAPEGGVTHVPQSWGVMGDTLLFDAVSSRENPIFSLWMLSLEGKKLSAVAGVESLNPTSAVFSPDGRWIAYNVYEPAKKIDEIYVQPFPATGARYQLPIARDNHHAAWSRDGKQLFYIPGPGEFAAIALTTTPTFAFGNLTSVRQVLLNYPPGSPRQYDVMPNDRLVGQLPDQATSGGSINPQIHIVLNWFEELKKLVPVR